MGSQELFFRIAKRKVALATRVKYSLRQYFKGLHLVVAVNAPQCFPIPEHTNSPFALSKLVSLPS